MWARDLQSTEALTLRARHERWACTTAAIPTEGDLEQGQHLTIIAMGCRSLLPGVEVHCTGTATDHWGPQPHKQCNSHLADLHPASDYKCFNSSSVSVYSWSWNYRGCWHQTCPPVDTHHCVWIASFPSSFTDCLNPQLVGEVVVCHTGTADHRLEPSTQHTAVEGQLALHSPPQLGDGLH